MEPTYVKYIHKPLADTGDQIRLMKLLPDLDEAGQIQCELETFNLSEAPPYHALSYEWGSSESLREVSIEGASLSIRPNLWLFLDTFRWRGDEDASSNLWIDQLCIDQSNTLERNHQVKLMGDIYSKADTVKVWLGPSDGYRTIVLEAMTKREHCCSLSNADWESLAVTQRQYLQEEDDIKRTLNVSACDACAYAIDAPGTCSDAEQQRYGKDISRLRYWSRLWIIQEIVLAKDVTFYLGVLRFPRTVIRRYIDIYDCYAPELNLNHLSSSIDPHGSSLNTSSYEVMTRYGSSHLRCTDPRDLVFGLMGMVNAADQITIDYGIPTSRLCEAVIKKLIASPEYRETGEPFLPYHADLLEWRLSVPCCWLVWLDVPIANKGLGLVRDISYVLRALDTHGLIRDRWSLNEIHDHPSSHDGFT